MSDGQVTTATMQDDADASATNDPRADGNWALAHIGAYEAWKAGTGEGVTVAVLDTGVDLDHPDLDGNIWTNSGEIAGDGKDNDGNGYVDDVHGWNFSSSGAGNDPNDVNSHGTHVAGLIGAEADNGTGIAGIAPDAEIMAVKVLGDSGSGSSSGIAKGIDYAVENGAKIINMSLAGSSAMSSVDAAIARAQDAGVIVVVAAGNSNKSEAQYPAYYTTKYDNVISVAASTKSDTIASWSNYSASRTSVDLAAPGSGLLSTTPNGNYGSKSGTSMASPVVAGAAAVVWDAFPNWSYKQVIDAILNAVSDIASLTKQTATNGVLDLAAAVAGAMPAPQPEPEPEPANEAPTLAVKMLVSSVAEETPAPSGGIRIADVTVTDDGVGVAIVTLSGADMADFELRDGGLYLRAGTTLDYETQSTLKVTVSVDDPEIGSGAEASRAVTVAVADVVEPEPEPAPEPAPTPSPDTVAPMPSDADFWFDASTVTGSTARLIDQSGNGLDAVAMSGGAFLQSASGGIVFDGDDVYRIDNDATVNSAGPYQTKSLTFVVAMGADVTSQQVLYEQGGTTRGLSITVDDGALHLNGWNFKESSWGVSTVSVDVSAGQEMAVTLVHDAGLGAITGYVNGAAIGSVDGVNALHAHGNPTGLGGTNGATRLQDGSGTNETFGWSGTLYEAAHHGRALSAEEVQSVHAGFAQKWATPEPAPEPEPAPAPEPAPSPDTVAPMPSDADFWFDASAITGSTARLIDQSGNGLDAKAVSGGAVLQSGGLAFDGDDVYRIGNDASVNLGGPFEAKSLTFVVAMGQDVSSQQVLYEQGGASRGLSITVDGGELHLNGWNYLEEAWSISTVSVGVSAGQDMAVTLVHDASLGAITGYVDGAKVGSVGDVGMLHAHGDPVGLGGTNGATRLQDGSGTNETFGWSGTLYEAAHHGRALSAAEVQSVHAGFAQKWGQGAEVGEVFTSLQQDHAIENATVLEIGGTAETYSFSTGTAGFTGAVALAAPTAAMSAAIVARNGGSDSFAFADAAGEAATEKMARVFEWAMAGEKGLSGEIVAEDAVRIDIDQGGIVDTAFFEGAFVTDLLSDAGLL